MQSAASFTAYLEAAAEKLIERQESKCIETIASLEHNVRRLINLMPKQLQEMKAQTFLAKYNGNFSEAIKDVEMKDSIGSEADGEEGELERILKASQIMKPKTVSGLRKSAKPTASSKYESPSKKAKRRHISRKKQLVN